MRYRQVLHIMPNHAACLNLLSTLALQVGHAGPALELADAAIRQQPQNAEFHANRGHAQKALGRLEEAIQSYRDSCRLNPAAPEAQYNLGNALQAAARTEDAVLAYERAVALQPRFPEAYNNLGNAQRALGRFAAAARSFQAAVDLQPANGVLHFNLAAASEEAGETERAAASYRVAARLAPDIEANALHASALLLRKTGYPAEAVLALQAAIARCPDDAALHNAICFPLTDCDRLQEAEDHLRTAISLEPGRWDALTNLGNLLRDSGRDAEAMACFDKALQLNPGFAPASYGRATTHLLAGRYAVGWLDYESRFEASHGVRSRFDAPIWTGEDLGDRTLLLHAEQGFGDTIHFCRYVPLAVAKAGVVLEVQPELRHLLTGIPGVVKTIAIGDELPPFDVHCPLMSLPRVFGTVIERIPADIPYLHADADRMAAWQIRLAKLPPGVRVGVVWQGLRRYAQDRLRSVPVALLDTLRDVRGATFISLQKGETAVPALIDYDWTAELHDFADTAALVANLDLVITVDTAVAHLAGALGRPVWMMNRYETDWRWQRGRTDSPWYPTMRLYRQQRRGEWASVVVAVREALECFCRKGEGESAHLPSSP